MAKELTVTTTTYDAKDGQRVTLTFETITKYLVQGHPEYVTRQEMMYFMGICKSRGLNPFAKDCYLIKYSQKDGAAIITAIDYFRKRARAQQDCKGWKKGIIVQRKGEILYTDGLMVEGDTLLGGWFKAKPEGWDEPFLLEVNLKGYIKHKSDGSVTKFWQKENQPSQIAKVAESQGLRTLWPDEFQQLYTQEELGEADTFKTVGDVLKGSEEEPGSLLKQFDDSIPPGTDQEHLNTFLKLCLQQDEESTTIDDIKIQAAQQLKEFWAQFKRWEKDLKKPETKKEDLSNYEAKARAGFINIKTAKTLIETEKLLKNEMLFWSPELKKEWSGKWFRMFDEKYVFPEAPKEEKEEPEAEAPITETEKEEERPDASIMLKCPINGEHVDVIYCERACENREKNGEIICDTFMKYMENLNGNRE